MGHLVEGPYAKESPTTIVLRVHLLMEEKQFWGDDRTVKRDNILMGQERSMYFFFFFFSKRIWLFFFSTLLLFSKKKKHNIIIVKGGWQFFAHVTQLKNTATTNRKFGVPFFPMWYGGSVSPISCNNMNKLWLSSSSILLPQRHRHHSQSKLQYIYKVIT